MASPLMPVLFLSHGAGPSWLISSKSRLAAIDRDSSSAKFMKNLPNLLQLPKPKAVLCISAHWEETHFTVNTSTKHKLLYDYGGFPPETYDLKWCPEGQPEVASDVKKLVEAAGFTCKETSARGLDHGVFIPCMFLFPEADVPFVELSLRKNMNLSEHLKLGEALQPLRNAGVLIIGSGFTTHHPMTKPLVPDWTKEYGQYIHDILGNKQYTAQERKERVSQVMHSEHYKKAHPTDDHFIPQPVALAAAGYSAGEKLNEEYIQGTLLFSNFIFRE